MSVNYISAEYNRNFRFAFLNGGFLHFVHVCSAAEHFTLTACECSVGKYYGAYFAVRYLLFQLVCFFYRKVNLSKLTYLFF